MASSSFLIFVPWAWINPLLVAKEIAGIMQYVAGARGFARSQPLDNIRIAFSGFGWLVLVGLGAGLPFWFRLRTPRLPIAAILVASIVVVSSAGRMTRHWGLLFFPAVVLVSAVGYDGMWSLAKGRLSAYALALVAAAISLAGVRQLAIAQEAVGDHNAYAKAHKWICNNMRSSDRIAIPALYPGTLPRTRAHLESLVAEIMGPNAYARKMASNDLVLQSHCRPFRLAVLNDELYTAHWFQRELAHRKDTEGFYITIHDDVKKFNAKPTSTVIAEFVAGRHGRAGGYDALILDKPRNVGVEPDQVFQSINSNSIYIYLKHINNN